MEFKAPKRYDTDFVTLTMKELEKLSKLPIKEEKFNKIRDVFIFSCLTGLRYSDVINLSANNFDLKHKLIPECLLLIMGL